MGWWQKLRAALSAPGHKGGAPEHDDAALLEAVYRRADARWEAQCKLRLAELVGTGDQRRIWVVEAMLEDGLIAQHPTEITRCLKRKLAVPTKILDAIVHQECALIQLRAKLQNMREQGVETYDVVTAGDAGVCAVCEALAVGSPYAIADQVIPGYPHCQRCRCTISPRA